jgi:hypothetical protein
VSTWTNLALACGDCNKRKANCLPHEVGLTLRQKPHEPNQFDPRFNFRLHINVLRPEWEPYQQWIIAEKQAWKYWNVALEA